MPSGLFGLLQKAATITALAGLAAGGVVALAATPAAAETSTTIPVSSWSYIDSAAPHQNLTSSADNAPVGTHIDAKGVAHTSKSYLTFDLTPLLGNQVSEAYLQSSETAVTDCSTTMATQAWITGPSGRPTWAHQPSEVTELDGPTNNFGQCPSPVEEWYATAAIQKAAADGQRFVTIALRLPDDQQADADDGRDYSAAASLHVMYDRPPNKPTNLTVNSAACTSTPIWAGPGFVNLQATVGDPDFEPVSEDFQWWPAAHPDQRTEINPSAFQTSIDASKLTDQTTYAWRVRSSDGTETGPWSSVCTFKTDLAIPNAPIVTSTDYPAGASAGGSGIPGTFTFNANGSSDVAGYRYGMTGVPVTYVAANQPGGNATFQFVPATTGYTRMTVESITHSGTPSQYTTYSFFVNNNLPNVDCGPNTAYIGTPRQCTLSPSAGSDVTGYVYSFDGGPSTTVSPGSDGTATVTVTPVSSFGHDTLNVQAKLSNGNLTGSNNFDVQSNTAMPTVTQSATEVPVGTGVQFTFTAVLPGSVSFTYTASGQQPITVPAGTDGTATVTVTPAFEGFEDVSVYSTSASGVKSGSADTDLVVDGNEPDVSSAQFPDFSSNNQPGTAGTFTFSSAVPGVTSYTYAFDGGDPVTVPAGADGTASVTLTTTTANPQVLIVTSTLPDGSTSERNQYEFSLDTRTPTVTCPQGQAGQPIQCTVQPGQDNVASYTYTFDNGPSTTAQAAPDGSAAITLTAPGTAGTYYLDITSADTAGLSSDLRIVAVTVVTGS